MTLNQVNTGLDLLHRSKMEELNGKRVAILGHPASVDSKLVHIIDRCLEHRVNVVKLFGPEHGIRGDLQDMDTVDGHVDPQTGIEVISLYGTTHESLLMKASDLVGVDILVCDLQDIGTRYYTYAYTIAFAMKACAQAGVQCLILDRPNPISAEIMEGNWVQPKYQSFVGEYPLLNRHGLTIGELAFFFQEQHLITENPFHQGKKCDFKVIWMENYNRGLSFKDTGLPWVLPSPNMPTLDTALVYPGGCLYEGTNLSEARGTTKPFEFVGAPYITDAHTFTAFAQKEAGPGVIFRACSFQPTFQKHSFNRCQGLQMHITNPKTFHSLRASIAVIRAAMQYEGWSWRTEAYEFVSDRLAIDLLFGDDRPRLMLENGSTTDEVLQYIEKDLPEHLEQREKYLYKGYNN